MVSLGHLDKSNFAQIEPLLTAGFKSKHRYVVNKTAEAWNAIVKDEEELECSDSLKAIVAALRPKVDLTLPGVEESSGEFGAQATSFIESQEDLSFIALSSAKSSRQDLKQATPPAISISKMAMKGPMTRKRRRDATPEVTHNKSTKRITTPRLRHDNSQIQFAPIQSSPLAEESQNLTERQREVRQRQRDNAGIYAGVRSSPRTRSQSALVEKTAEPAVTTSAGGPQATPERNTSYEDYITSTPTPRRGQAVHLAEENEPPSSPLEPRPYPLLGEIQTRSKSRNTMENWEFSSPPGSPTANRQQSHDVPELPHITLTEDSTQFKVEEQPDADIAAMEVIPSSANIVEEPSVEPAKEEPEVQDDTSSELSAIPSDPPMTPPPRRFSDNEDVQETPKSGNDEFVDARSSPLRPSSPINPPPANQEMASTPNKDASFYLSEIDESSMMRFVVELESRRCNLPINKVNSVSVSPEKRIKDPAEECITVSSPGDSKKKSKRSVSPMVPSTPLEPAADISSQSVSQDEDQSQSQSQSQTERPKRKRKRSAKYSETRRKKRRAAETTIPEQIDDSQPADTAVPESITSEAPSVRRSPRRIHGLRSRNKQSSQSQSPSPDAEVAQPSQVDVPSLDKLAEAREGGDTDEELMSQLVTESFAASQSQSQQEVAMGGNGDVEDSVDLVQPGDEAEISKEGKGGNRKSKRKSSEASKASKANSIMQILRGGLDELREAALSREEVYQLEDVLMDMKRELFAAERRGRA